MLHLMHSRLTFYPNNESVTRTLFFSHSFLRFRSQCVCCKPSWSTSASVIVTLKYSLFDQLRALLPINLYLPKNFSHDYHVLLFKRPKSSPSFGCKMVFPGGIVCKTDFDGYGWSEYAPLEAKFETRATPPMYTELQRQFFMVGNSLPLHPSVGLRLCALRELFEETGLLLVENDSVPYSSVCALILNGGELRYWQDQLFHNPSSFPKLYKHLGQRPPLRALSEWSNWLTPKEFERRFDTMFYFVHVERILFETGSFGSHVRWQSPEVDTMYVGQPPAFLHDSTHSLAPPQIYELGRLCQFIHSDQLATFAQQRAYLGCRRWCPVSISVTICGQQCTIYLAPGDQRYDQAVRSTYTEWTVEDLASDRHRNRLVISADASQLWWDSSVYELGHVTPVTRAEYRKLYS